MKTVTKRKSNHSIWKQIALGALVGVLTELLLAGALSLFIVMEKIPDPEKGVYGYVITGIAVLVGILLAGAGDGKTAVAIGICSAILLIHCAINIMFFNAVFQRVGFGVLSVTVGGIAGLLPRFKKRQPRRFKISNKI